MLAHFPFLIDAIHICVQYKSKQYPVSHEDLKSKFIILIFFSFKIACNAQPCTKSMGIKFSGVQKIENDNCVTYAN